MKTTFRTAFGRPGEAVQTTAEGPDKWALLDRLTIAADSFELSHRTLTVLKALLSFLPSRHIPDGAAGVVFASNARLSDRLHGMPESTLRRHLAQLVRLGLIVRRDSPNRKRFARNRGSEIALAFGFDLAPLVEQAALIEQTAQKAQAELEALMAQRDRVLVLRHALIRRDGVTVLTDEVGRMLRRRPVAAMLSEMEATLKEALSIETEAAFKGKAHLSTSNAIPAQVSANDNQNERHIQDSNKSYLNSEKKAARNTPRDKTADKKKESPRLADNGVTLSDVLSLCKEMRVFFPETLRDWRDLVRVGDQIAPMLGIDQPVLLEAKRDMGVESAAVTVICLLEKAATIRSPGAYLRRLTQMAREGRFSLGPMLTALRNQVDCQLTT